MTTKKKTKGNAGDGEVGELLEGGITEMLGSMGIQALTEWESPERIRTGSLALDYMTGGGLPRGRIVTVEGLPQFGKSTVATIAASYITSHPDEMTHNGLVAYYDLENAYDPKWGVKLGVDQKRMAIIQPEGVFEKAMDDIIRLLEKSLLDLIVIDSAPAALFAADAEASMQDNPMMIAARRWSMFFRKIAPLVRLSGTCLLIINQMRTNTKAQSKYDRQHVAPGGLAFEHYPSIIVEMMAPARLPEDKAKTQIGMTFRPRARKNKTAPKRGPVEVPLCTVPGYFGVDQTTELVTMGLEMGIFTNEAGTPLKELAKIAGNWFFDGAKLGVGKAQVYASLEEDDEIAAAVESGIRERINATDDTSETDTETA